MNTTMSSGEGAMAFLQLGRLAETLRQLATDGPDGFHAGEIGRALIADLSTMGCRLSQQDLGSMVGATRESVNKQLRKWTQTGVLHRETGCVVISDFPALRAASSV